VTGDRVDPGAVDGFAGTALTGPWSGSGYLLTRGSGLAGAGVRGA